MRVFSFVPAVLLAASGFVAAAPTAADAVVVRDVPSAQDVISKVTAANEQLASLKNELSTLTATPSPNVDELNTVVSQVTVIVSTVSGELQSVQVTSLSASDLTNLASVAGTLGGLLSSILANLVPVLKNILSVAVPETLTAVQNLLNALVPLINFLDAWTVPTLAGVLGPVLVILDTTLNGVATLLGIPA